LEVFEEVAGFKSTKKSIEKRKLEGIGN
jgi:hypothetical protein